MSAKSLQRLRSTVLGLGAACSLAACSLDKASDETASLGASVLNLSAPPVLASGRSTIEGRYVYAPPDEGEFTMHLNLGGAGAGEMVIVEPSMINGDAQVRFVYSKKKNLVEMTAKFKGLPYRPSYKREFDPTSPFNKHFMEVKNAKWQFWLIGTTFGRQREDLYFDATTLKFLGTRYDFVPIGPKPAPAPGSFFTVQAPVVQMLCSPLFEGKPNGEGEVKFRFRYDRLEDAAGTPGTIYALTAFDACKPDHYDPYWTNSRLPDEKYMTWDTVLQSIWNGENFAVAMSAEPDPKPVELAYRDNTFLGWTGYYPAEIPKGLMANNKTGTILGPVTPGVHQAPMYPPSRRNLCGGGQ